MRLALFDVDGTLIRTRGVGVEAFYRAMATEFGVIVGHGQIRFGGRTDTSLVRELFDCCGIEHTPEHVRRFFDAYVFWLDHLLVENKSGAVCPGVWRMLEALSNLPEPPKIGLLTGNIRLGAEIKLRHFGLWRMFETGGFGDDHEDRNQIAAITRERGGQMIGRTLSGEEILVVGDTIHDVACGRSIGARVLAVATGGATWAELQACSPDWLVASLDEVDAAVICQDRHGIGVVLGKAGVASDAVTGQCECGLPVPHMPHEPGLPVQLTSGSPPPPAEAKTESFLTRRVDPQWGHFVPVQSEERTRSSLSCWHFSQWNS